MSECAGSTQAGETAMKKIGSSTGAPLRTSVQLRLHSARRQSRFGTRRRDSASPRRCPRPRLCETNSLPQPDRVVSGDTCFNTQLLGLRRRVSACVPACRSADYGRRARPPAQGRPPSRGVARRGRAKRGWCGRAGRHKNVCGRHPGPPVNDRRTDRLSASVSAAV